MVKQNMEKHFWDCAAQQEFPGEEWIGEVIMCDTCVADHNNCW